MGCDHRGFQFQCYSKTKSSTSKRKISVLSPASWYEYGKRMKKDLQIRQIVFFFMFFFLRVEVLQGIYHGSTIVPLLCLIIPVPPSSHLEKHHGSRGPILMVILCYTEGHVYTYYIYGLYTYIQIYIYIILQNPLFFGLPEKKHVFSK